MEIKIDKDGSIISGDETITSNGTIIRDDGTIENTNVGGSVASAPSYVPHTPPISPLNNESRNDNDPDGNTIQESKGTALKAIADLEYELMVVEGKVKNAISRESIVACIVCTIIGFFFIPGFIGTAIAGVIIFKGYTKRTEAQSAAEKIRQEISKLKSR